MTLGNAKNFATPSAVKNGRKGRASKMKKDPSLVGLVCFKFRVHPAVVFSLALQYAELRLNGQEARERFEHNRTTHKMDVAIDDFCLDLLAGRIGMNTLLKLQGCVPIVKQLTDGKNPWLGGDNEPHQ